MALRGADLVAHQQEGVPPEGRRQSTAGHGQGKGQGGGALHAPDVEGQQGHLGEALPVQHRPQQPDQAGAPAAVAGLGDQHAGAGRVIFPGAQGVEHLSGDEDEGVAQVVVGAAQAQVLHLRPVSLQHHRGPRRGLKRPLEQRPVGVQQGGNQQRFGGHGSTFFNHRWYIREEKSQIVSKRLAPALRPAAFGRGSPQCRGRCWRRNPR